MPLIGELVADPFGEVDTTAGALTGPLVADPFGDTEAEAAPPPATDDQDFPTLFRDSLAKYEGRVDKVYPDRGGLAFGYGHFIKPGDPEYGFSEGTAVSPERVEQAFKADMDIALKDARAVFPNFDTLPRNTKLAIGNMAYQMGRGDLADFDEFKAAVDKGDWRTAAAEMRDSLWARQTPKRANQLAALVESQTTPSRAPARDTTFLGEVEEVFKGPPAGAVSSVGTAMRGVSAQMDVDNERGLERAKAGLDTGLGILADLEKGVPNDYAWMDLSRRISTDKSLLPNERGILDEALQGTVRGDGDAVARARSLLQENYDQRLQRPVVPLTERPLFKAGEAVTEFGETLFPAKPGYEESFGRMVGEGLGSLGSGVLASIVAGPLAAGTLFTFMGAGEAADRAVQAGASDDEIMLAAGLGMGPGGTDIVPAEILLRRLPPPARKTIAEAVKRFGGERIARVLGRIGLQGLIEAGQEGTQQVLQNWIAREVHSPDTSLGEGVLPSTGVGGTVGTIAGTAKEVIVGLAGRRSGARNGYRAKAVDTVPPPTPEDEASPIPTEDIIEGRQRIADAQAKEGVNVLLRERELPEVGMPVRLNRIGADPFEGIVEDITLEDEAAGIGPELSVVGVDGESRIDVSLDQLQNLGITIQPLPMPASQEEIEAQQIEVEKEARRVDEEVRKQAEKVVGPNTRVKDIPTLTMAESVELGEMISARVTPQEALGRILSAREAQTVQAVPVGAPTVEAVPSDEFTTTPIPLGPPARGRAIPPDEAATTDPELAALDEKLERLDQFTVEPTAAPAAAPAREIEPDTIVRKDGSPFQTEGGARLAARSKKIDAVPVEVDGGWALQLTPAQAATTVARDVPVPEAGPPLRPTETGQEVVEAITPTESFEAPPAVARDEREAPQPIVRVNGEPYKTRAAAMLAARSRKIDAEPVEVAGGWGLQTTPAEEITAPTEPQPSAAPEPDAPPVETASPAAPDAPVPVTEGLWGFKPETLSTDARAFQYKEGGDEAGVTERLQGVKRWDPDKSGIAMVYERRDGTRVIADGHQRLGLAKRLAAEGQDPRIIGRLYREADGWTVEDIREKAALKNIAEGTGTAFDAATVLRDSRDPESALAELPPQSSLVRTAKEIAKLDEEPFRMAKAAKLKDSHAAVIGRVADGDGPLQEALVKEFSDRKPPNVDQAEALARLFKEDRTENETTEDLFGEQEVATSFYRERARIIASTINRLKQDKRVFATLGRHAEQIEAAGNVLSGENVEIAEQAGQAAFLVQQLATRAGPVSDTVKAAAERAHDTGNYQGAVSEVVDAVKEWIATGGGEVGLGRRGARAAVAEGRDVEATSPGRAPEAGRVDGDPDLDVEAIPTAAELEAEGQAPMFRREDAPPQRADETRARIRLNRRFDKAHEGISRDLQRVARKTFGEGFNVELVESITPPGGGRATGAFDPVNRIAYIALRAEQEGMTGSLFHEGFHYLRNGGAFSKPDGTPTAQWRTLEREAPKWREQYGIDERYGQDASEDLKNEEAIAEALADYTARGKEAGFSPTVRAAFDRILRFFRGVANGLRMRGFKTWEDVFDRDIMSGRAGQRVSEPVRISEARKHELAEHRREFELREDQQLFLPLAGARGPGAVRSEGAPEIPRRISRLVRTSLVAVENARVGIDTIATPEDAAHAFAPFRKEPAETLIAAVVGDGGKLLGLIRHAIGTPAFTPLHMSTLLGSVAQVPGSKGFWLAHQHPTGDPTPSVADENVYRDVADAARDTGIEYHGGLVIGVGRTDATFQSPRPSALRSTIPIRPAARTGTVPVFHRRWAKVPTADRPQIDRAQKAIDEARQHLPEYSGLLLLDQKNKVAGAFVAGAGELANMRQSGAARELMQAIAETNAMSAVAFVPGNHPQAREAARNVFRFGRDMGQPGGFTIHEAYEMTPDGFEKHTYTKDILGDTRAVADRYLQTAWHGSPHAFDAFSAEAIGTGEGAQVYGWGLYFASKKEVAEWYRGNLSDREVRVHGELVSEDKTPSGWDWVERDPIGRGAPFRAVWSRFVRELQSGLTLDSARNAANRLIDGAVTDKTKDLNYWRSQVETLGGAAEAAAETLEQELEGLNALELALRDLRGADVSSQSGGRTYRVDLAPQEDEYLLWDEPLSEQSDKVRQSLRDLAVDYDFLGDSWPTEGEWSHHTGEYLYNLVTGVEEGSQRDASEALLSKGIRGIKYRDAATRGQEGEGSYNFVIFDDSDIAVEEIMLQRERLGLFDTEETDQGEQAVIPGTERITDRELAERRAEEPLRATRAQRPMDEGLFGEPDTQIDLEEAIAQRSLFQREPSAEDKGDFDRAASDWAGHDLTGIAEGVTRDKRSFERFAEDLKAQLKGTAAVTPSNVEVEDTKTVKDLGPFMHYFAPPAAWSKRYPEINKVIQSGIKAEMDMSNRIRRLSRDWDRITKRLSKKEFVDLTGIMFLGDAEAHTFSDGELKNFVTTDKVRQAYKEARRFIDKLGRFTEQHRKAMALNVLTRRTKLLRKMAGARGMDIAEFRKLYNARADLLQEQRQGKVNPKTFEADLAEATLALHGEAPINEDYESWAEEVDRLEPQIRDIKIRRREAYVPHMFFGKWRIFEQAVGEDGDPILDDFGEPTWNHVAGDHGFFPTRREAVLAAGRLAKAEPNAKLKVAPEEFNFPRDEATMLGDAAFFRFLGKVGEQFEVQGEDLNELVMGVARRRFRRRIADFEQYRQNIEGYSKDLDRVIRSHIGHTVRYVSLDRLKYDAINTIEREGLSPFRSAVQDRPELAAAMNQWLKDVNGEKQRLENYVDNMLDKPWVTPLRAGLAAGGLAFAATGGLIGPGGITISALAATYIGYRVGRGLQGGSEFASRATTGAMLGDMSHAKLGMFTNLMSALVNTTQVAMNTAPVLGTRDTLVGTKRLEKAIRSKLRGKPNADWRLLERNDIHPLDTMAEGTRHQFQKEGRLSKMSMLFFTAAESFNRGTTLLGAINKAQREGKSPAEANRFAREAMTRTQFHYGAANKPELLRNVFLRVPLQFKNFVAQQLTFVLGLSRRELPKFLLSMTLTAGLLGFPGLDLLDMLTDWLFEFSPIAWMKLKALEAAALGELHDGIATFLTRGLPGLGGVDMAGRVGMGDKFLPLQVRDWKGAWMSTLEGAVRHGKENTTIADQLRNISPGVGNPLKVLENWQNGGMVTNPWKRNRPEYQMTPGEMALKAIGARPIREARLQDLREIEQRDTAFLGRDALWYVDRIVEAELKGDEREVDRLYADAEAEGVRISDQSVRSAKRAMGRTRAERDLRELPRDLRDRGERLREAIGGP